MSIAEYSRSKWKELKEEFSFEYKSSPFRTTISRFLSLLSLKEFQQKVTHWIEQIAKEAADVVSVDGKTTKGSYVLNREDLCIVFLILWLKNFIEQLALEARAGKEIDSRFYTGNEYGFFARYYLINDVYGITGLMIHHILPDSHMSWERYEKTLRMPGLGVGYNPFGDVYLELLYLHTGTQEIGYEKGTDPFTYQGYQKPMKIYWILKFGLGLSFDLYRKQ